MPKRKIYRTLGGGGGIKQLTIDGVIRRLKELRKIYGGGEPIYYHIPGSLGVDCWDCPLEAEKIEVRKTPTLGYKITIV